jgi:hypothetical protein
MMCYRGTDRRAALDGGAPRAHGASRAGDTPCEKRQVLVLLVVVLQWCYSGVTEALCWCYVCIIFVLYWRCRGLIVSAGQSTHLTREGKRQN